MDVAVTFSEAVTITGSPTLKLTVGSNERMATYISSDARNALASATKYFRYTIVAGDTDANGIAIPINALTPSNTDSIKDAAGNAATITSTAVPDNNDYIVDNTAPAFSSATAPAFPENTATATPVYTATATDSGTVTYSLKTGVGDQASFNINNSTGAVTFKASPNFEAKASYSFTVVATDAAGNTSAQAVSVNITDVNEAPTVKANAPGSATFVNGSNAVTFQLSDVFADEDAGDTLTYSLTTGNLPTGLSLASGAISGTPSVDFTGSVTITANDSHGLSSVPKTIQIDVTSKPKVSSIAVFDSGTGNLAELGRQGETVSLDVSLSETVTFTGTPSSSNLTATFTAGGTALSSVSFVSQSTNADGKTVLHFTGVLPSGNASSVVLDRHDPQQWPHAHWQQQPPGHGPQPNRPGRQRQLHAG